MLFDSIFLPELFADQIGDLPILSIALPLAQAMGEALNHELKNENSYIYSLAGIVARQSAKMIPVSVQSNRSLIGRMLPTATDISTRAGHVQSNLCGNEIIDRIRTHHNPVMSEYVVQLHMAERAGPHWDLQINLDGSGHRWVIKRMKFPIKPPDRPLKAIQQPTHAPDFVNVGAMVIKEGYGKGYYKVVDRDTIEVNQSSNDQMEFTVYRGPHPGRYAMKRWYIDKDGRSNAAGRGEPTGEWMFLQMKDDPVPPHIERPTDNFKDVKQEFTTDEHIILEKMDGTHSVLHLDTIYRFGNQLISRRPSKASNTNWIARGGVIRQQDKVPHIRDMDIAILVKFANLDVTQWLKVAGISSEQIRSVEPIVRKHAYLGSVITFDDYNGTILHVEVHHDMGHSMVGRMLNSHPAGARELQTEHGKLNAYILDIHSYKGNEVKDLSFEQRYALMVEVQKYHPLLRLPNRLPEGESHRDFHNRIIANGGEGTMVISKDGKYGTFQYKVKGPMDNEFTEVYYIVDFTDSTGDFSGQDGIGAIEYSRTPKGPILGKVGTGLTHEDRIDMKENPDKYIGKRVVIESKHPITKGKAVRAPSVHEIKIDKPEPDVEG